MDRVTHYECAGLGFESLVARQIKKGSVKNVGVDTISIRT